MPRHALRVPGSALSPEAALARSVFEGMTDAAVRDVVRTCSSGLELVLGGFADDVDIAVEVDSSRVVPLLSDGAFRPAPEPR